MNEKKTKEKEKKRIKILDKIIKEIKTEIPEVLIESEKNKLLNEAKFNVEQMGLEWNKYLEHLKKTEEEILKEMDNDAVKRVKYGLILNEISTKEKINVSQQELETETDKMAEFYKKSGHNLDREKIKSYVYGILSNEKIFKFLESC
jgi:trigger factor